MSEHDEIIGRNLARLRDSVSQTDLASRMRTRGHKWTQPTVVSIEKGERPLRVSEAMDVSEILGVDLYDLVTYPPALTFYYQMSRTEEARAQMLAWALRYEAQAQLLVKEAAEYQKATGESLDYEIDNLEIVKGSGMSELLSAQAALAGFIKLEAAGPAGWGPAEAPSSSLMARFPPRLIDDGERQAEA